MRGMVCQFVYLILFCSELNERLATGLKLSAKVQKTKFPKDHADQFPTIFYIGNRRPLKVQVYGIKGCSTKALTYRHITDW